MKICNNETNRHEIGKSEHFETDLVFNLLFHLQTRLVTSFVGNFHFFISTHFASSWVSVCRQLSTLRNSQLARVAETIWRLRLQQFAELESFLSCLHISSSPVLSLETQLGTTKGELRIRNEKRSPSGCLVSRESRASLGRGCGALGAVPWCPGTPSGNVTESRREISGGGAGGLRRSPFFFLRAPISVL